VGLVKNYYVVLGIGRSESADDVRRAFLELAKRYHPDHAGPDSTPRFQEIQEAYDVLGDDERRREYNHALRRDEDRRRAVERARDTMRLGDFLMVRPSLEALRARLSGDFTGIGIPKSARMEPVAVEVLLSPEEALSGGVLRLGVPAFRICPGCAGSGRSWLFSCADCLGEGLVEETQPVDIPIPPMMRRDAVVDVPIPGLAAPNLFLRAHLRITS
jgi:DnaJ-class molecular chaperone